ncbi:MAG: beta-N-acetylhexosaminidase, partial [Pedobacter sp.]
MKFIASIIFLFSLNFTVFAQTIEGNSETATDLESYANSEIAIIPAPANLTKLAGHFLLPNSITIQVGKSPELKQTIEFLQERLSIPTGYHVNVINPPTANATIKLIINDTEDASIGIEGYHLSVGVKQVVVRA